jgi:hypothetical protein
MKPRTPHAINQFVAANRTIQFYLELCNKYEERIYNWRSRHFLFNFGDGIKYEVTPAGNFIYGAAHRYLERFLGHEPCSYYSKEPIEIGSRYFTTELSDFARVETGLSGVWCVIGDCPFIENGRRSYRFKVNTHEPLSTGQVVPIAKAGIERLLYPEGILRDIQVRERCTKGDVARWYKILKPDIRKAQAFSWTKCHKAMLRRLRKKHNIILVNSYEGDIKADYSQAIRCGRYNKPTKVNARAWHITYCDIEQWCDGEGVEVDEDTILEAYDELCSIPSQIS